MRLQAIADAVDPVLLTGPYHEASRRLVNQHGFNLALDRTLDHKPSAKLHFWRGNLHPQFLLPVSLRACRHWIFSVSGPWGFVTFVAGWVRL